MSEIKADALTGKTAAGNVTVTSEGGAVTFQLQQGLAKAWNFFDGTAATIAFADSFNSSTLTDNGTGSYKYAFTNSMSNANFSFGGASIVGTTNFGLMTGTETAGSHPRSTSSSGQFFCTSTASVNSGADAYSISTQIFGDLA